MKMFRTMTIVALSIAASACNYSPTTPKPTLHEVMTGSIDPVADIIWGEANKAYGEDGKAAPGVLVDAEWTRIAKAGRDLHNGAMAIANDPNIRGVAPGVKILDEGTVPEAVTAAQVAGYLDRDRPGLTRHARELATIALAIETAAKARDVVTTVQLSEELDDVCESCHKRFWYPDQAKTVAEAAAK